MKKQKPELTIDTTVTRISQNTRSNKATRASHANRSGNKEKEPDFIEQFKKMSPEELKQYKQSLEEKRAALQKNLFPHSIFTPKSLDKNKNTDTGKKENKEEIQDNSKEASSSTKKKRRTPIFE